MSSSETLDPEVHLCFRRIAGPALLIGLGWLALLEFMMLCSLGGQPLPGLDIGLWAMAPMILPVLVASYFLARLWWQRECRAALADPEWYRRWARSATIMYEWAMWRRPRGPDGQEVYPEPRFMFKGYWVALPFLLVLVVFCWLWPLAGVDPTGPLFLVWGAGFTAYGAVWFWCYDAPLAPPRDPRAPPTPTTR
jgi:hypothetical protein